MSPHLIFSSIIWGDKETKLKLRCPVLQEWWGLEFSVYSMFTVSLASHEQASERLQAFPPTRSNSISIHSLELLSDLKVKSSLSPQPPALSQPPGQVERVAVQTGTGRKQGLSLVALLLVSNVPIPPSPFLIHQAQPPMTGPQDQALGGRTEQWRPEIRIVDPHMVVLHSWNLKKIQTTKCSARKAHYRSWKAMCVLTEKG